MSHVSQTGVPHFSVSGHLSTNADIRLYGASDGDFLTVIICARRNQRPYILLISLCLLSIKENEKVRYVERYVEELYNFIARDKDL